MLELLHIENVAVIEKADIEFGGGLNVLTGETGAGKSIIIDSLYAVTGGRASKELVRTGAKSAVINGTLSCPGAERWLEENGIEPDESGQIILSRRITAEGKSACRVNGSPVTATQLRELGAELLDIHGQNDGRKLMDEASHLKYLDGFAGDEKELDEYCGAYGEYKEIRSQLNALAMDEGEKARRIDTLRYQIEEIEAANIRDGESDELTGRRELLKNASKLTDALDSALYALSGGDRSEGAVSLLDNAQGDISHAARYAPALEAIASKLTDVKCEAEDALEELRDFQYELDFSPQELDDIELRLRLLNRLMKKYGSSESEVLEYLEKCRGELEDIELSEEKVIELERRRAEALEKARTLAQKLSKRRKDAARSLERQIIGQLSELNMKGVKFTVEFAPVGGEEGLDKNGCDQVRFLMSANAGERPDRISRIASGGELSRIMLAMKNVLSENDSVGTMVFDEIDTGVSGIAAQRVGEKLSALSDGKQVLCVTHLPQIAAMADVHFVIEKQQRESRTYTSVKRLDIDGRKHEIARLTGGDNVTELTLDSAAEQLEAADSYKSQRRK